MGNTIVVEQVGDDLAVVSPYDKRFVARAKTMGGKWDAARKAWMFPGGNADLVQTALRDVYGYVPGAPLHEQLVEFDAWLLEEDGRSWTLDGVRVATRFARDSAVRLADGVSLVSGMFASWGGSVNNPRVTTAGDDDVILRMRVTDRQLAWLQERNRKSSCRLEVVDDTAATLDALLAQRDALLAQLESVTQQINNLQGKTKEEDHG